MGKFHVAALNINGLTQKLKSLKFGGRKQATKSKESLNVFYALILFDFSSSEYVLFL